MNQPSTAIQTTRTRRRSAPHAHGKSTAQTAAKWRRSCSEAHEQKPTKRAASEHETHAVKSTRTHANETQHYSMEGRSRQEDRHQRAAGQSMQPETSKRLGEDRDVLVDDGQRAELHVARGQIRLPRLRHNERAAQRCVHQSHATERFRTSARMRSSNG